MGISAPVLEFEPHPNTLQQDEKTRESHDLHEWRALSIEGDFRSLVTSFLDPSLPVVRHPSDMFRLFSRVTDGGFHSWERVPTGVQLSLKRSE
jgi:hypothetical protein